MRIKNKYLRNRHVWNKIWKRVRNRYHPYETYFLYWFHGSLYDSAEEQVKYHFKKIDREAREIYNGHRNVFFRNASASYRRHLNGIRKAKERAAIARIRNGDYEIEMPKFKNDAAWAYW